MQVIYFGRFETSPLDQKALMQAPPRCEEATKRVAVKQWNKAHETKSDHDKHGKGKGKHKKDESDSEGDDSDDPCECDLCVEHN